ncbi:MAG: hypothetical protein COX79_00465 [Candidatus Levybacteria bacterium CG_4_10_14_0_2_um_filter_36_16]|nr:MAG: hypothetical protein AUK12_04285 [Candidatus Levybacteria bacterium CG2_30_37_29]PIR79519.1 MAG: hypothetical protein COU26_00605 [Candidatus Levybacteria bacterium CG10_big_fil_rev_8_21_14_0_10_36_30]PIZ97955.1 MAG: hypothetical protein COX79_00465 [Candidatus Levybacteria bacterium CG_4_10_14_0_2_um_filter_36_16]
MPAPKLVQQSEEKAKEIISSVSKQTLKAAEDAGREAFAQMLGIPLPDKTVKQIQEQDAATSGAQIAERQNELRTIANNNKPSEQITPDQAERTKRDTGLTHEEAEARLNSTLFHQAQQMGQTEKNDQQRREQQREKEEEEEKLRKEREEQERLSTPISLPGGKRAGMNPTPNRASTGEKLKNRDA